MTVTPLEPAVSIRPPLPRGWGHQFVVYADACSGIPGAPHERNFSAINSVAGLTANRQELEAQWRYWLDREMGWLDQEAIPLWHTTGNHTAYDSMSEGVFRDVIGHLSGGVSAVDMAIPVTGHFVASIWRRR